MADTEKNSYWREPLLAFGRMSGWVVGPIFLALIVGKWLDGKFGTAPFIFIGATGLAFIISIAGLVRESNKYLKTVKPLNTKKEEKPTNNESDIASDN